MISGGKAAVEALQAAGVDRIFGLMGSSMLDMYDALYERYIAESIVSPRYNVVAQSCGADGYFVSQPGEVADALGQAIKADKPAVIHVKVDPDAIVSSRKDALKHRVRAP